MIRDPYTISKALKLTPAEVQELKSALDRITVYDVWRLVGLSGYRQLPHDRSDHQCLSPFRDEDNASFSIFDNGRRWKDHGDPDKSHGDQVDFLERATNLDRVVASRIIIAISQNANHDDQHNYRGPLWPSGGEIYNPFSDPSKAAKRAQWPILEIPTPEEIAKIARLRGLSPDGVEAAATRGYLRCATSRETRVWVITDNTRYAAQARRLDGRKLEYLNGAKAASLSGSIGTWPIGIKEAATFPAIALVEGGPDLLAAIDLIMAAGAEGEITPVAMLGASMRIAEEALPLFTGKHVRIFAHMDPAGTAAGEVWAGQLQSIGIDVTGYSFSGLTLGDTPVSDLNDFAKLLPENPTIEDLTRVGGLLSEALAFTN